jgi:NAD+ kinase
VKKQTGKNRIKTLGIFANLTKSDISEVISTLVKTLRKNKLDYLLDASLLTVKEKFKVRIGREYFVNENDLCRRSDIIISIGGDGTMLATSLKAHSYNKPVLGVNLGKLGFLAEVNINQMETFVKELKTGNYTIGNRLVLRAECLGHKIDKLYAINDFVVDKGAWPKMIDLSIYVGKEHVTTFAADGLIISTPTGSTGYNISTGGPIVSPKLDVIVLSPISPHSLTMRPLVLPNKEPIFIQTVSQHKEILINCDGQRVFTFPPPLQIKITKSPKPLKLVHTSLTSYFETLRSKLLWGVDLRRNSLS